MIPGEKFNPMWTFHTSHCIHFWEFIWLLMKSNVNSPPPNESSSKLIDGFKHYWPILISDWAWIVLTTHHSDRAWIILTTNHALIRIRFIHPPVIHGRPVPISQESPASWLWWVLVPTGLPVTTDPAKVLHWLDYWYLIRQLRSLISGFVVLVHLPGICGFAQLT